MKRLLLAVFVFGLIVTAGAQTPEMFRYQGRLIDGTNLVNDTLPMSFKLYDDLTSGNKLYEDSTAVLVVDGLYSAMIGDDTVFGSLTDALNNSAVYLELTVNGETLSPREQLVSVPYALNALELAPRYIDNNDGTVTDTETGLMWMKDADVGEMEWGDGMAYCGNLVTNGYDDWRLPSVSEEGDLAEFDTLFREYGDPSGGWEGFAGTPFVGVQESEYWSRSPLDNPDRAITVDMGSSAYLNSGLKSNSRYIWPVRGGDEFVLERIISLDGNVNFKNVYTGGVRTAVLEISNAGTDVLTVTGVDYSDASFSGSWSGVLQVGELTNITVTFTPVAETRSGGTITVNADQTSGDNTMACKGSWFTAHYVDHGDGTVTDNLTGLMWMKNANLGSMSWDAAVAYCENLVTNGYSDWRLPTIAQHGGSAELETLYGSVGDPSETWQGFGETPFIGVHVNSYQVRYWAGPSDGSNWATSISMNNGVPYSSLKYNNQYVWPVRAGD